MQLVYSPYAVPLILAAVLSAVVAGYVWPRRRVQGATALALIAAVIAVWAMGYALEIASVTLPAKILWGKVQYIGIAFAPYCWLLFGVAYTSQGQTRPWRGLRWLAVLPTITTLLAFTTEWHGLIWSEMVVIQTADLAVLGVSYGPWFWFHFATSYLFLLGGTAVIVRGLWHMQGLYRAQVVALLVAILSPWVSNILFFAGVSPVPGLDLTPFAFTVTVVALAWGIFGYRLVDIAPIARDLVLEAMRDGVIVVNEQGRVADINPAAARLIGLPVSQALGKPVAQLLAPWPHVLAHLQTGIEVQDELAIGAGEVQLRYGVRVAPLYDRQQRPIGHIVTTFEGGQAAAPARPRMVSTNKALGKETAVESDPSSLSAISIWGIIVRFLIPPPKDNVEVLVGESPVLSQLLERTFTAMLRFAAVFFGFALMAVANNMLREAPPVYFLFLGGLAIVLFLALARNIPFVYRARTFLILFYLIALVEVANYGYSIEAFIFFLTLSALALVLRGVRDGLLVTLISTITLLGFGWQIGQGAYWPLAIPLTNAPPPPVNAEYALTGVLVFAANAAMLVVAISILLQSVNRAWGQETQAKNLLQQERDALDQRVIERTQQLREQEANWRMLINSSPAIIVQVNREFKILFGRIPGVAEDEITNTIIGQNFLDFIHEADRPKAVQMVASVFEERQTAHIEFVAQNPYYKAYRSYLTSMAPLFNGEQVEAVLFVCTDITERKEAEAALKAYADELAQLTAEQNIILDNTAAAIFLQKNRQLVWVNRSTEKLFGYTSAEMLQLPNAAYHVSPEAYAAFGATVTPPMERGELATAEIQIRRKDGGLRWVFVTGQALNPERVYEDGIMWILQDITERKAAEATLQAYAEQLALARDQALEASRYKSILLSKVTHELRTPLGGILGYAELLHEEMAGPLEEEQKLFVSHIVTSAQHLGGLITDLLDQAQIEQGTMKVVDQYVDLHEMVAYLQDLLHPLAAVKNLQFSFHTAPDLPRAIISDEKRLRQIIINLTNNAIKFTNTGWVTVSLRPTADQLRIEVQDTGLGIPPEAQSRVFESFWQVENTPVSTQKGYGLGLSIVQQLVSLMGGEIELESEVGRGSTFIVSLPLRTE